MNDLESETVWVRMGCSTPTRASASRHTWVDSAPAWLPVPRRATRYGRGLPSGAAGEALLVRVRRG